MPYMPAGRRAHAGLPGAAPPPAGSSPPLPTPCSLLLLPTPVRRYAEGCSALAVATAGGRVGLHLLAGAASPCWHEAAPQCVCEGVDILGVRSQVRCAAL